MSLNFRKPVTNDFGEILRLLNSHISNFHPPKGKFEKIFSEFNNNPLRHSIVVLLDRKIIGFGSLSIGSRIRGGDIAYIEDIVVDGYYQNMGVGTKLVQQLVNLSKEIGCISCILCSSDELLQFYSKSGFEKTGNCLRKMLF